MPQYADIFLEVKSGIHENLTKALCVLMLCAFTALLACCLGGVHGDARRVWPRWQASGDQSASTDCGHFRQVDVMGACCRRTLTVQRRNSIDTGRRIAQLSPARGFESGVDIPREWLWAVFIPAGRGG